MLKLGFVPESLCHDLRDNVRRAPLIEKAGFDFIWEGDHLLPWNHSLGHSFSLLVAMEAYLQRTDRISVVGLLAPIGVRYQPVDVAVHFAAMANLHPDRVALCVGTGEAMNERAATGVWPSASERRDRLVEAVDIIRRCWTSNDYFHYKGRFFRTFFHLYSRPPNPIPIYVAANGPIMARYAGQIGDGHIAVGVPPSYYRDTLHPCLASGAAGAGRDYATLDRCAWVSTAFHPDRDRALEYARLYGGLLIPECYTYIHDPRVIEARARLVKDEALQEAFCIASSPEEVVERFSQFIEAGCTHIVWADMSPDPELALDVCAKEIVPALKAKYGKAETEKAASSSAT